MVAGAHGFRLLLRHRRWSHAGRWDTCKIKGKVVKGAGSLVFVELLLGRGGLRLLRKTEVGNGEIWGSFRSSLALLFEGRRIVVGSVGFLGFCGWWFAGNGLWVVVCCLLENGEK
ncbi:hypothetical protein R3W88_032323 [Solanum pinnatisectum]|uniref:Uncharacterized protein n=1 Tax=Solanum pinnatisectum TaxID=50273 RepID=A0AAV9LNV2_9SOLN|nr:hypothetical protein R3W88_032323 [Solanum pinnatisectum]